MDDINFNILVEQHNRFMNGSISQEDLPKLKCKYGELPVVAIDTKPYNKERLFPDKQGETTPSSYYQVYFGLPNDRGDIAIEMTQDMAQGTHAEEGVGYWVSAWDVQNEKPVRCGHLQPEPDKPLLEQLGEFVNKNHALGVAYGDLDTTKQPRPDRPR